MGRGEKIPGEKSPTGMLVLLRAGKLDLRVTLVSKSKRSCSAVTWEPRCSAPSPRTRRSAKFSRWVAVWFVMQARRWA